MPAGLVQVTSAIPVAVSVAVRSSFPSPDTLPVTLSVVPGSVKVGPRVELDCRLAAVGTSPMASAVRELQVLTHAYTPHKRWSDGTGDTASTAHSLDQSERCLQVLCLVCLWQGRGPMCDCRVRRPALGHLWPLG